MRELAWWTEWPAGMIRVGVIFVVAVTTLAGLVRYPSVLRELGAEASNNSSLSYSDREVAGGNGVVAEQAAVYAARALIPAGEAFNVVVSERFDGGSELTVPYVASYFRYFLVPRRLSEGAPWLVCYACDLSEYGDRAEIVWSSDDDISIVRIGS
ncbi:MAG TPA: hypothetical protein VFO64_04025 [Gaiellaceae bacterium]|jgi:hypothetical protein|nr:hypothetical protein [Gaiellaceae bacterium]